MISIENEFFKDSNNDVHFMIHLKGRLEGGQGADTFSFEVVATTAAMCFFCVMCIIQMRRYFRTLCDADRSAQNATGTERDVNTYTGRDAMCLPVLYDCLAAAHSWCFVAFYYIELNVFLYLVAKACTGKETLFDDRDGFSNSYLSAFLVTEVTLIQFDWHWINCAKRVLIERLVCMYANSYVYIGRVIGEWKSGKIPVFTLMAVESENDQIAAGLQDDAFTYARMPAQDSAICRRGRSLSSPSCMASLSGFSPKAASPEADSTWLAEAEVRRLKHMHDGFCEDVYLNPHPNPTSDGSLGGVDGQIIGVSGDVNGVPRRHTMSGDEVDLTTWFRPDLTQQVGIHAYSVSEHMYRNKSFGIDLTYIPICVYTFICRPVYRLTNPSRSARSH